MWGKKYLNLIESGSQKANPTTNQDEIACDILTYDISL